MTTTVRTIRSSWVRFRWRAPCRWNHCWTRSSPPAGRACAWSVSETLSGPGEDQRVLSSGGSSTCRTSPSSPTRNRSSPETAMAWKDEDQGLPIKLGPCSNAEYDPQPLAPVLIETIRRAREECEWNVRRTGMTRRQFLLSACGAATTLFVLNACTREAERARPTTPSSEPGGSYTTPPEATTEPPAAQEAVGGEEFVFDIQGHLLEYDLNPVFHGQDFWKLFPQRSCGEEDPRVCYSIDHFMQEMFLR